MKKYLATFILSDALLLCLFVSAQSKASYYFTAQAPAQTVAAEPFTAIVTSEEARFTMPVPQRREWKWRQPETKERAQEYRMDVSVKNEGTEYTFGFYLWKPRTGARSGAGSFAELLDAGQRSVFERPANTRGFSLIPDAGVKVSQKGDALVITISGRKNVARLFSGKPSEVTFKIAVPNDDPKWKTVAVKYQGS